MNDRHQDGVYLYLIHYVKSKNKNHFNINTHQVDRWVRFENN